MSALIWIIVAIVVIAIVVVVGLAAARRRRETELRQRFGREYDRAVERTGDRRQAQEQLADVARRRDQLEIKDLDPATRTRFDEAWMAVQTRFVDEPGQAVTDADGLVTAVMRSRGYPVEDFEERAWMLATDHSDVVDHYRRARAAHARHLQAGRADTEDLRQAFRHYRMLYGVLSGRGNDPNFNPMASGSGGPAGAHAAPYPVDGATAAGAGAAGAGAGAAGTDAGRDREGRTVAERVMRERPADDGTGDRVVEEEDRVIDLRDPERDPEQERVGGQDRRRPDGGS